MSGAIELPGHLRDDFILERGVEGQPTMRRILGAAGLLDRKHVIDYGGGRGTWVWTLAGSTVYDPYETELAPGREVAEAAGLSLTFTADRDSIPTGDGMLLIGTQQKLSDRELHDFFGFAHDRLVPRGRLLATLASPVMVLELLLRGSTLRSEGLRGQLALAGYLVAGGRRKIGNGTRPLYCHRTSAFVKAASQHGLSHVATLPRSLDREYRRMVGVRNRGRFYNWLVFVRD